jgi:hypothetical protein
MSLDVYLIDPKTKQQVYSRNITHNLNTMAEESGIYKALWRPEEIGITKARQIIKPLEKGLAKLATNKAHYEQFNAPNGWGMWEHFIVFCADYLQACRDNPEALVEISR